MSCIDHAAPHQNGVVHGSAPDLFAVENEASQLAAADFQSSRCLPEHRKLRNASSLVDWQLNSSSDNNLEVLEQVQPLLRISAGQLAGQTELNLVTEAANRNGSGADVNVQLLQRHLIGDLSA